MRLEMVVICAHVQGHGVVEDRTSTGNVTDLCVTRGSIADFQYSDWHVSHRLSPDLHQCAC